MSTFKHIDHSSPIAVGDIRLDAILPPQVDVDFDFERFEALMLELTAAVRASGAGTRDVWKPIVPEIRVIVPEQKPPAIFVNPPEVKFQAAPQVHVKVSLPKWPVLVAGLVPGAMLALDILARIFWAR